jgi:hypothetical protein
MSRSVRTSVRPPRCESASLVGPDRSILRDDRNLQVELVIHRRSRCGPEPDSRVRKMYRGLSKARARRSQFYRSGPVSHLWSTWAVLALTSHARLRVRASSPYQRASRHFIRYLLQSRRSPAPAKPTRPFPQVTRPLPAYWPPLDRPLRPPPRGLQAIADVHPAYKPLLSSLCGLAV